MMDFPAPVSPVRTFSPGSRRTASRSMTAKFSMRSSISMVPDDRPARAGRINS